MNPISTTRSFRKTDKIALKQTSGASQAPKRSESNIELVLLYFGHLHNPFWTVKNYRVGFEALLRPLYGSKMPEMDSH